MAVDITLNITLHAVNNVGEELNRIFSKTHGGNKSEIVEAPTAAKMRAPDMRVIGFNVYESTEHGFALGKKTYASSGQAEFKRTQNGKWIGSFDLNVDVANGNVETNELLVGQMDERFFALLPSTQTETGYRASKGRNTQREVIADYPDAIAVFGVGLDENDEVHAFAI